MRIAKTLIITAVLALVVALPAQAMVLGLDWGFGRSTAHVTYKGSNLNLWAGSFAGYQGGTLGNPKPPVDGHFFGYLYCVDLEHLISLPTEYEVDPLTTSALTNGGRAAWLYKTYSGFSTDASKAAALQLALWDVVVDNGDGFAGGNFKYTGGLASSIATDASSMISASAGKGSQAAYFRPTGGYGQAMIGPVPEPGSFALLGLGLALSFGGLALRRRR